MAIHKIVVGFQIEAKDYNEAFHNVVNWLDALAINDMPKGTDDVANEAYISRKWGDDNYNRFEAELYALNYEVDTYKGRDYYAGPAVKVDNDRELAEVLARTSVPCRWDNLGKNGYVVYPREK